MNKSRIIATSLATLAIALAAISASAQPVPTQLPAFGPQHIHRPIYPHPSYIVVPSYTHLEWRHERELRDLRVRNVELEEQVEELKKEIAKLKSEKQ